MKTLSAGEIRGTWGALLLPLHGDDSIDYAQLREQIQAMAAAGLDGVYSNGSAGEFYAQTEAEFDAISTLLAEECGRLGLAYQIGVCHMSPQTSVERLRRASQLQPGAVQVILPDWFAPSPDEALAYLSRMAELAGPIGLVVYNPLHAKRVLKPEDWVRLVEAVPQIVGLKVAGGDADWYQRMAPVLARAAVFVPGHALATGFSRGAAGSYSNVACLTPWGARAWFGLMQTDPARALAWERQIQGFIGEEIAPFITQQGYTNCAVDKLLACIGGWAPLTTRIRWPYRSIPATEVTRLREVARRRLPELWAAS